MSKAREFRNEIVRMATETGASQKEIAAALGIDRSMVCRVLSNKTGKVHAPPPGDWKRHGTYLVSHDGQVFSEKTGTILKPDTDREGYRIVTLAGRKIKLHRLVLTVWDRSPLPGEIARHSDGDVTNNRADNLTWGTVSDNEKDKRRHGRANRHHTHPESRFTADQVSSIRTEYAKLRPTFEQNRHLKRPDVLTVSRWVLSQAERYGVTAGAIKHIIDGRTYVGPYAPD